MGTSVNIAVGSQVWVDDVELAWVDGEVKALTAREATIFTSHGKTVVADISNIYPNDTKAPPAGVNDMTKLAYLHEPGVLHNLACRFVLNEIYTYTGNILIAVNPFRSLPHLYDIEKMEQYEGAPFGELSPHLFAVADTSYRAMIYEQKSQSILVSGESGAGKTEISKMLTRYLAFIGGRSKSEGRMEQQLLRSNPVLEAFGNAKTVKNNNSSRFGKFDEIQFDEHGKISGAAIRTYLLERSRVCQVSDPERNYHCFYMLCAAPPEDREKFKHGDPRTFHYLNQSNCYKVANVDDAREYLETRNAMDIVGFSQDEQNAIFRVVAAILHLGNVNFTKGKEVDSSRLKDAKSSYHLRTAAELLMCNEKALEDSLCKRVIVTPDGKITKPLDPELATLSRDALAKTVYSRVFDWIVDKINVSIGQDPNAARLIGVLDIFGFESFKINSFEQLCINFTNEKLQQHFNQHVFKMEQKECTREEIDWSYVEFADNQDVLDLIEKKPGGIIALLDEACMFPQSTHETFAQKMYQTYKGNKRFSKPKLARTDFTINHYAGDVTYQADQFLDKNKDYVVAEHQALLNASKCLFVSNLFPPLREEALKQSKFSSIGTRFKQQLQALMKTLNDTEPHYIRCVKPNTVLKPGIFENLNVLNQLRCGGVLEAIRISCAGYPTKRTFDEFLDRFRMLVPNLSEGSNKKAACIAICDKMCLKGYQIGKTKVFLRAGQMAELATHVKIQENGHLTGEDNGTKESGQSVSLLSRQRLLTERQQENHDILIKFLLEEKQFDNERSKAACIVFASLLQWKAFEADKTNIFERIIQAIRSSFESQDRIDNLAYWLSTTSTLLFLLQNAIKASNSPNPALNRTRNIPAMLFGATPQGFHSSSMSLGISSGYSGMMDKPSEQSKIEAKYPALLFKQQLTACVEKLYGIIRDSLKKEISQFLSLCLQVPRSARGKRMRSNIGAEQHTSNACWQSIVEKLDQYLSIISHNHVPSMITRKFFIQVFSSINVQLFNSLLVRRECCSFSSGGYLNTGMQKLEEWCLKAPDQSAALLMEELLHIRQAVGFLVSLPRFPMFYSRSVPKAQKSLDEITNELCPKLSIPQINRIGTMFWDDKYGTRGLSLDVIGKMTALTAADSTNTNNSFLLDENSSSPFSMEEVLRCCGSSINDPGNADPLPLLRQRSDFHFPTQLQPED